MRDIQKDGGQDTDAVWRKYGATEETVCSTIMDSKREFVRYDTIASMACCDSDFILPVLNLLYASFTIPLVYCHINSFQRASSVEKPLPGGEKRRGGQASHHEEL